MSNWFASKWTAGKWYEEWFGTVKVPVPVLPPVAVGAAAKSGGYRGFMSPGKILHITKLIDRPDINLVFTRKELEERIPLKRQVSPDRKEIYDLRKKVADLKRKLHDKQVSEREFLQEAADLRAQIEALSKRVERLSGELEQEQARRLDIIRAIPWFTASLVTGLASTFLLKDDTSKFVGYSSAVVLAAVGMAEIFIPIRPGQVLEAPPRKESPYLGVGVIRR